MKVSFNWLKDFVDIDISPELLAQKLMNIGFEVDAIEYQNQKVQNVWTAKIVSVDKHPNADRLSVCKVQVKDQELQIVTAAKVCANEIVALALDGAQLANGVEIKSGELRGIHSEGMFCGLEELDLSEDDVIGVAKDDIVRLKDFDKTCVNIYDAVGHNDVILDVAITANRPDCNSIYGIAKEIAAMLDKDLRLPELDFATSCKSVFDMVSVKVDNKELCPRYVASGIKNVVIKESELWIKKRLRSIGIRPINNIVDITNYVLLELGQPMHAFDRRDLEGDCIIVRNARSGERIVSLDGKENILDEEMLVICDAKKPVAVAGIMGGENSGIKDDTTEVIFESARFLRESVRHTSRKLNLFSDSSSRFEKGVGFNLQKFATFRALSLIASSSSGEIAKDIIDVTVDFSTQKEVEFSTDMLSNILGIDVDRANLVSILERLDIKVKEKGDNLVAIIPLHREDISGVNDIAEEYIRLHGIENVQKTIFAHSQFTKVSNDNCFDFEITLKKALSALGLNEIINYSFVSSRFAKNLCVDDKAIALLNPLSDNISTMRTTLTHSMLESISFNLSKSNDSGALFEVGSVYLPQELPLKELPEEEQRLCVGMFGTDTDFFSIKAVLEALFKKLHFELKLQKKRYEFLHYGRSAAVFANGKEVGYIGEIHPCVAKNYDIEKRVYVAELSAQALLEVYQSSLQYKEISRYPAVQRDLAVVIARDIEAGSLTDLIKEAKVNNLTDCEIFDVFEGEALKDKKSVAIRFEFVSLKKTMTDDEINASIKSILELLKKNFGAELRQ